MVKLTGTRDTYELLRDANGNYYTIPGMGGTYQEMNNPSGHDGVSQQLRTGHISLCLSSPLTSSSGTT